MKNENQKSWKKWTFQLHADFFPKSLPTHIKEGIYPKKRSTSNSGLMEKIGLNGLTSLCHYMICLLTWWTLEYGKFLGQTVRSFWDTASQNRARNLGFSILKWCMKLCIASGLTLKLLCWSIQHFTTTDTNISSLCDWTWHHQDPGHRLQSQQSESDNHRELRAQSLGGRRQSPRSSSGPWSPQSRYILT